MEYQFEFGWIAQAWPAFLRAALITLRLLITSGVLAIAIGLIAGQLLTLRRWWIVLPVRLYVDFFRLTPILLHIVLFVFLLPIVFGIRTSAFTGAVIAISLNYGAFFSEIFRAGVTSLDKGQREAAEAMGMPRLKVLTRVIYPQAIRRMLPPLGSMLVSLTKDTSLASVVAVSELFNIAQTVGAGNFRQIEALLFVSLIYLIINIPLARFAEVMHRRLIVNA